MRLRTVGRMLAVVVALAAFSGTAHAETAAEILVKMDKTVNGFDDQFMDNTMTIINIDGSKKSYRFSILQKGEKRLIRFSTGEMKEWQTLLKGLDGFMRIFLDKRRSDVFQLITCSNHLQVQTLATMTWPYILAWKLYRRDKSQDDNYCFDLHCYSRKSAPYHCRGQG